MDGSLAHLIRQVLSYGLAQSFFYYERVILWTTLCNYAAYRADKSLSMDYQSVAGTTLSVLAILFKLRYRSIATAWASQGGLVGL